MQPMLSQGAFLPARQSRERAGTGAERVRVALLRRRGVRRHGHYYRFENGGVWFFNLNTVEPISQGTDQAIWLQAELESAALQPGHRLSVVCTFTAAAHLRDTGDDAAASRTWPDLRGQQGAVRDPGAHARLRALRVPSGPTYITTAGGGGLLGDVDEEHRPPSLRPSAWRAGNSTRHHLPGRSRRGDG